MAAATGAPARSEDAIASLLLTTGLADPGAAPLSPPRYWALLGSVPSPAELLTAAASDIARRTGLAADESARVERLLAAGTSLAFALERLERRGFVSLTAFDPGYPVRLRERLGDQAPPVLFTVGDRRLLATEGIGVVGSRSVDRGGAEVARRVATAAAGAGLTVVSGGARGVDAEAMSSASAAGGGVVGLLADPLARRVREPDVRRAVSGGSTCLATAFDPAAGFSAANALARNKLIYASARATLVVACDLERGGTWEGAMEAIREGYGTVMAWTGPGAGPGNERLVERGAIPIHEVAAVLHQPSGGRVGPAASDQLQLGL